jgi:hypothetical protein
MRFIDYHEGRQIALEKHAAAVLDKYRANGWIQGVHHLPHDGGNADLTAPTGEDGRPMSRKAIVEQAGLTNTIVVPRISDVHEGIAQLRRAMPRAWFHKTRCARGIKAMTHYRWRYDESNDTFFGVPLHNWASNGVDALRQWAQGYTTDTGRAAWDRDIPEDDEGIL